jgi:hypothetical protein
MMLVIVGVLIAAFLYVHFAKESHPKTGNVVVHVSNTIGGIFGYTTIILIVAGVTTVHCTLAVILFDLSLLICSGMHCTILFICNICHFLP